MWKQFQEEMYSRKLIEIKEGFMLYSYFKDNTAYIHVAYVKPEFRGNEIVRKMEKILLEKHNPKSIACYVDLTANNPELSLIAIVKAGYKIINSTPDKVVLYKEVNNG